MVLVNVLSAIRCMFCYVLPTSQICLAIRIYELSTNNCNQADCLTNLIKNVNKYTLALSLCKSFRHKVSCSIFFLIYSKRNSALRAICEAIFILIIICKSAWHNVQPASRKLGVWSWTCVENNICISFGVHTS